MARMRSIGTMTTKMMIILRIQAKFPILTLKSEVQGVGFTGGLAGYNYNADITDCYAIAAVKINEEESSSGYGFGGLAGCSSGQITGSYAHCTVTGDEAVGGL